MRHITVSVLCVFVVFPAFAASRLPVVNVGAGGVSARAAFGVPASNTPAAAKSKITDLYGDEPAPAVTASPMPKRNVVARAAAPVQKSAPQIDAGARIAAADVLMPHRPSADLWAHSDAPLRMPTESEISVVRADYDLPEESLDTAISRTPASDKIAAAAPVARAGALDAEIERLMELQRRADASVSAPRVAAAAPSHDTVAPTTIRNIAARGTAKTAPVVKSNDASADEFAVRTRRLVVPMDDDVVVRAVEKNASPRIAAVRDDMTSMSPSELRRAFRKTYLSENKHLSTFQMDDRFDVASDMTSDIEGFTARRDLSEGSGVRPLEIKIRFRGDDSALSRDNYNLLTEYAGIVVSNPKRAIQVSIPQSATTNMDDRKLAARRLAIVEQVLRDTGVSEQRIMPVLSPRDVDGFVLRIISSDQYETLSQQQRDMFGDTVGKKTYKSLAW